jgi:hypothetical protein
MTEIIIWWSLIGYAFCLLIGKIYERFNTKAAYPVRAILIAMGGPLMWLAYSDEQWWKP